MKCKRRIPKRRHLDTELRTIHYIKISSMVTLLNAITILYYIFLDLRRNDTLISKMACILTQLELQISCHQFNSTKIFFLLDYFFIVIKYM